jgi:hypothetical protein
MTVRGLMSEIFGKICFQNSFIGYFVKINVFKFLVFILLHVSARVGHPEA